MAENKELAAHVVPAITVNPNAASVMQPTMAALTGNVQLPSGPNTISGTMAGIYPEVAAAILNPPVHGYKPPAKFGDTGRVSEPAAEKADEGKGSPAVTV